MGISATFPCIEENRPPSQRPFLHPSQLVGRSPYSYHPLLYLVQDRELCLIQQSHPSIDLTTFRSGRLVKSICSM